MVLLLSFLEALRSDPNFLSSAPAMSTPISASVHCMHEYCRYCHAKTSSVGVERLDLLPRGSPEFYASYRHHPPPQRNRRHIEKVRYGEVGDGMLPYFYSRLLGHGQSQVFRSWML